MIACPVCRAENTERTCRRCRADLGLLFDIEANRSTVIDQAKRRAVAALLSGDFEVAYRWWRQTDPAS